MRKCLKNFGLVVASAALLGVSLGAQAAPLRLNNVSLPPLNISIFSQQRNDFLLSGRAFLLQEKLDGAKVDSVQFRLIDDHRAVVWENITMWEDRFLNGPQVIIPFQFNFSSQRFHGDFQFQISLLDAEGSLLSRRNKIVSFPVPETEEPRFSEIKDLALDLTASPPTATAMVTHWGEAGLFQGELLLFRESLDRPRIALVKTPAFPLKKGETKAITIEFEKPTAPQLYTGEMKVVAEAGAPITGTLQKQFRIPGDFVELTDVSVTPQEYWSAQTPVSLTVEGLATKPNVPLFVEVSVWSGEEKVTPNQLLPQQQRVETDAQGRFSLTQQFPIQKAAAQLHGEVVVRRGEAVLGRQKFSTKIYPKWERQEGQSEVEFQVHRARSAFAEASLQQKLLLLFGAVILLAVIVGLVIFARTSRKHLLFFLVVGGMLSFGIAHAAEAPWGATYVEAVPFELYNPSPSAEEGFRIIRLSGNLEHDIEGGAFDQEGIQNEGEVILTELEFLPQEGGDSVIVTGQDFLALSSSAFQADFVLSSASFSDGMYDVILRFGVGGSTGFQPWVSTETGGADIELGLSDVVQLDQTPPTVSFYFYRQVGADWYELEEGQFTRKVLIEVLCDDGATGSGCVVSSGGTIEPEDLFAEQNYCDEEGCSAGIRSFEHCDLAGNCTQTAPPDFEITQIDKNKPELSGMSLRGEDGPDTQSIPAEGPALKALSEFFFGVEDLVDTGGTPSKNNKAVCNGIDYYTVEDSLCKAPAPCAVDPVTERGLWSDGNCQECVDGYYWDTGAGQCLPIVCDYDFPLDFHFCLRDQKPDCDRIFPLDFDFCFNEGPCTPDSSCAENTCEGETCWDGCGGSVEGTKVDGACCTDEVWSPETGTVCWGESFPQTSTCDGARTETGTLTCDDTNPCTNDSCAAGACSYENVADGTACPGGTCQGGVCETCVPSTWLPSPDGHCGMFEQTSDCGTTRTETGTLICDDGKECTTNACSDDACVYTPKSEGTSCNGGAGMCDASGDCVECLGAGDCNDSNECTTDTCGAGVCSNVPVGSGISCTGGVCDGSGGCVECLDAGDCNDSNECTADTCNSGTCENTPVGEGTPCAGGTCDAGGECLASCGATTLANCELVETDSENTSGMCETGYGGSCEYLCNNGTWEAQSNTCVACTPDVEQNCDLAAFITNKISPPISLYAGDVYSYDSCGNPSIQEDCPGNYCLLSSGDPPDPDFHKQCATLMWDESQLCGSDPTKALWTCCLGKVDATGFGLCLDDDDVCRNSSFTINAEPTIVPVCPS